jgi:hypothetical protein
MSDLLFEFTGLAQRFTLYSSLQAQIARKSKIYPQLEKRSTAHEDYAPKDEDLHINIRVVLFMISA